MEKEVKGRSQWASNVFNKEERMEVKGLLGPK